MKQFCDNFYNESVQGSLALFEALMGSLLKGERG